MHHGFLLELSRTVILIEEDVTTCGECQILVAVIVPIDQECAVRRFDKVESGFGGDVFGGAICLLDKQSVRQATCFTDVNIISAIAIDIADGETVVARAGTFVRDGDIITPVATN